MGYTNGFNTDKVIDALVGRLGWKQPTKQGSPVLNSTNTQSNSGRYFNDGSFHPLATIENLKATIEDSEIADDSFNNYIEDLQNSIVMQCLTAVFNKPELIEQTRLFERSMNNDQLISNNGKFVGVRFKLSKENVALQVNSIAFYFNEAVTFTLRLYHETKKEPVWSQEVTTIANDQTIIIPETELILSSNDFYKSGYFYLGYYQDDLGTAKAWYEQYEKEESYAFEYGFFGCEPEGDSFNKTNVSTGSYNFGLNAEVTTFRDHTEKIIRNAHLFDNAQGLQMAYHICKQILYAIRSNVNERILKEQVEKFGLMYELDGKVPLSDVPKSTGLQDKINQELNRINKTFFSEPKAQTVNLAACYL